MILIFACLASFALVESSIGIQSTCTEFTPVQPTFTDNSFIYRQPDDHIPLAGICNLAPKLEQECAQYSTNCITTACDNRVGLDGKFGSQCVATFKATNTACTDLIKDLSGVERMIPGRCIEGACIHFNDESVECPDGTFAVEYEFNACGVFDFQKTYSFSGKQETTIGQEAESFGPELKNVDCLVDQVGFKNSEGQNFPGAETSFVSYSDSTRCYMGNTGSDCEINESGCYEYQEMEIQWFPGSRQARLLMPFQSIEMVPHLDCPPFEECRAQVQCKGFGPVPCGGHTKTCGQKPCQENPCGADQCCTDVELDGIWRAQCDDCPTPPKPCESNPCDPGCTCMDHADGSHSCSCLPTCADNPCDPGCTCSNLPNGGFDCDCLPSPPTCATDNPCLGRCECRDLVQGGMTCDCPTCASLPCLQDSCQCIENNLHGRQCNCDVPCRGLDLTSNGCGSDSSDDDTQSVRRHLAGYSKWRNVKKLHEKAVGDRFDDLCGASSDSSDSDSFDDAERQVGDDDDSDDSNDSDSNSGDDSCESSDEFGNTLHDDCAPCNRCHCPVHDNSHSSDSGDSDSGGSSFDSDDGGFFDFGGFDDAQVGKMSYNVSTVSWVFKDLEYFMAAVGLFSLVFIGTRYLCNKRGGYSSVPGPVEENEI